MNPDGDRGGGGDDAHLLGCGRSILDLTPAERARINRAGCVLARNKFAAFHQMAGLRPTHIWFTDVHPPGPEVLRTIIEICRRDRLKDLTFILRQGGCAFEVDPVRYWRYRLSRAIRRVEGWQVYRAEPTWRAEFVALQDWRLPDGTWAKGLDERLYHYKTSFTSALNYLAITRPGLTIRLVGVDFNSPGYFFDEEMARRKYAWSDWSTAIQAEQKKHLGLIADDGPPITAYFPTLRALMAESGNRLACNNASSVVVQDGLADFEPIPAPSAEPAGSPASG